MTLWINPYCFTFTGTCPDGFQADTSDLVNKASKIWGSGAGGLNVSFAPGDFPEGHSNFIVAAEDALQDLADPS